MSTANEAKESHPVRGAWIEMEHSKSYFGTPLSHPVRGAWIEMWSLEDVDSSNAGLSHPVRGAWIEIDSPASHLRYVVVAPRQGCVD